MAAARLPLPAASRCPQNTRGPCMVCAILHPIAPIAQVILCTIFRFLRKCPTCRLCLPQPQGVLFHNHRRNQFPERLSCHEKREKKRREKRKPQETRQLSINPNKTTPSAAISAGLLSEGLSAPDVVAGEGAMVATRVPPGLVEPGRGAGVVKVNTPQDTSAAPNVLVQAVCVGPVTVPCR